MKKQLLLLAMILLPLVASAHDIEVQNADGVTIYYNYINNGTELAVTFRGSRFNDYSNEYQGNVAIPEEVTFMNRTRKVTHVVIRAHRWTPNYLRTLPLHHSQRELESTADYTDFSFDIRPTADFLNELLKHGAGIEILEPLDLREKVHQMFSEALNRYE